MQFYTNNITNPAGTALAGLSVRVQNQDGSTATIYSDNGITPATNPLTTDGTGSFGFYAANGRYQLAISGNGITPYTVKDILLHDPTQAFTNDIDMANLANTANGKGADLIANAAKKVASIAALKALRVPQGSDAQTLIVDGYATIGDGGGGVFQWWPNASQADDAGIYISPTGNAGNGRWVRADWHLFTPINPLWYGADPTGTNDATALIQKAINYAATSTKSVIIPDGTFLLGTLTYLDPTGNTGDRIWGLLFAKPNVTVFGNGKRSTLKAAAGLVATNYTQAGTKGFQVFVHSNPTIAVDNFTIRDFTIDFNGYNNTVYPANSYGNQSTCHGLYIEKGDRVHVRNILFKDHPGHQVISLGYSTTNCLVQDNEFINCGWLGGSNPNLTDHSSMYIAGDSYLVTGNRLSQTSLPPIGCAIELHGSGVAQNNKIDNYLSGFNTAALVRNGEHKIAKNILNNVALGITLYAGNTYTLRTTIVGNVVDMSYVAVPNTSPAYQYRNGVYAGTATIGNNPGSVDLIVKDNIFKMIGTKGWSTDTEDLYNTFLVAQLVKSLVVENNMVQGFRGAILQLERQASAASVTVAKNSFLSCGRKDNYVDNNSVVNYTNALDSSYGVALNNLTFTKNHFTSCFYANYLNMTGVAAGNLVCPGNVTVVDDSHDRWLSLFSQTGSYDISSSLKYEFRYKVSAIPDTTKPFPSTTNAMKYSFGIVEAQQITGWPCKFFSVYNITDWKFEGLTFGGAPTSTRPFGVKAGDYVRDLAAAAGGYSGFYATTGGTVQNTAWAANTAYALNAQVYNGANVYTCTTAGTSAASGGPTGTGTSIADGTAVWTYTDTRAIWKGSGINQS